MADVYRDGVRTEVKKRMIVKRRSEKRGRKRWAYTSYTPLPTTSRGMTTPAVVPPESSPSARGRALALPFQLDMVREEFVPGRLMSGLFDGRNFLFGKHIINRHTTPNVT